MTFIETIAPMENFTDMFDVTVTGEPTIKPDDESLMLQILNGLQLMITIPGFFANIATCITLSVNGNKFSPAILILLHHQSICDAFVCLTATLLIFEPFMWLPGVKHLDLLVCCYWNSQTMYWLFVLVSIYNLVYLAYERFLAVCRPFKHQNLTNKKLYFTICTTYVMSQIFLIPTLFQVRYIESDDICLAIYFRDDKLVNSIFTTFGFLCFIVYYLLPVMYFCILYGQVIMAFNKRKTKSELASSRVIDKATTELTKTAIVVTVIFIIAIGVELWYYVLGYAGVVKYVQNSPEQMIGVLLASFNSFANPFVYGLLVPAYRKSLKMTFCMWEHKT